jgi:hypothetical protein
LSLTLIHDLDRSVRILPLTRIGTDRGRCCEPSLRNPVLDRRGQTLPGKVAAANYDMQPQSHEIRLCRGDFSHITGVPWVIRDFHMGILHLGVLHLGVLPPCQWANDYILGFSDRCPPDRGTDSYEGRGRVPSRNHSRVARGRRLARP